MELVERELLTIVAEAALEPRLVSDLSEVGITGYTVTSSHGAGTRGQREGDFQGGNVRIECVTTLEKAEAALKVLADRYFTHYACVAWLGSVRVVRADHF